MITYEELRLVAAARCTPGEEYARELFARAAAELECSARCADELRAVLGAKDGEGALDAARRAVAERDSYVSAFERAVQRAAGYMRERDEAKAALERSEAGAAAVREAIEWAREAGAKQLHGPLTLTRTSPRAGGCPMGERCPSCDRPHTTEPEYVAWLRADPATRGTLDTCITRVGGTACLPVDWATRCRAAERYISTLEDTDPLIAAKCTAAYGARDAWIAAGGRLEGPT